MGDNNGLQGGVISHIPKLNVVTVAARSDWYKGRVALTVCYFINVSGGTRKQYQRIPASPPQDQFIVALGWQYAVDA
jgi:hypothetical protein